MEIGTCSLIWTPRCLKESECVFKQKPSFFECVIILGALSNAAMAELSYAEPWSLPQGRRKRCNRCRTTFRDHGLSIHVLCTAKFSLHFILPFLYRCSKNFVYSSPCNAISCKRACHSQTPQELNIVPTSTYLRLLSGTWSFVFYVLSCCFSKLLP